MADPHDILRVILELHPAWLQEGDGKKRWKRSDLRKYQLVLIDILKRCGNDVDMIPGALLALDPGAGKTGTVLTAMRDQLDSGKIRKVLIVASVLVAQTVWPAEIDEWEHLKDTTYTLLRVEDDDPHTTAAGDRAYAEALARYQAQFDAEVQDMVTLGVKKKEATAAVRQAWQEAARAAQSPEDREKKRKPKATPAERADVERNAVILATKERKLAWLCSQDTEIHIINKEALGWLWNHFGKGARWPYDILITDDLREGRSGEKRILRGNDKYSSTKRKAAPLSRFGVLAAARKHVQATIELTGTPTPKGLENMWGLMYLIDLGRRLGDTKEAFMMRWFNVNQYSRKVTPKDHAFDEIMGIVKDIMFSLDPADLPQLPGLLPVPIKVKLPPAVMAEYRSFERHLVSEEYDVEAVNAGVHHGKLLQFANGSMFQEDGNDIWIHDCKVEALKELVDSLDGTPLLVAYTYTFDVERIVKAIPDAVVLTPQNSVKFVKDWNADKIAVGLVHRASAGHGLNLQKGTGHICEYGLTSDAELAEQFWFRVNRSGRTEVVFNHIIMAEGTIDEQIFPDYLDPKMDMQNRIKAAVRVDLN